AYSGVARTIDDKTSFNALPINLQSVAKYISNNSSWRPPNSIAGFRLNEGLLGTNTRLLNLGEYMDTVELKYMFSRLIYADPAFIEGSDFYELVNMLTKTAWAHMLIDRYGR